MKLYYRKVSGWIRVVNCYHLPVVIGSLERLRLEGKRTGLMRDTGLGEIPEMTGEVAGLPRIIGLWITVVCEVGRWIQ